MQPNILILTSNYYTDLSTQHLQHCVDTLTSMSYTYHIETVEAGAYELPAVMEQYHRHHPFKAYIPLGLLVKGSTDHYEFIWEHLKACFTAFTLQGIIFGNGVITAPTIDILTDRVNNGERAVEACRAVDYLLRLQSSR